MRMQLENDLRGKMEELDHMKFNKSQLEGRIQNLESKVIIILRVNYM